MKEKRTIKVERKEKKMKKQKEEKTNEFMGITFTGDAIDLFNDAIEENSFHADFEERGHTLEWHLIDERKLTPKLMNEVAEIIRDYLFKFSIIHTFLSWVNYCSNMIMDSLEKIDLSNHSCDNKFDCLICGIRHESEFAKNRAENLKMIRIAYAHQKANDCKIKNPNKCKACKNVLMMEFHNKMRNPFTEIQDSHIDVIEYQNKHISNLDTLKHLGVALFNLFKFKNESKKGGSFELLKAHEFNRETKKWETRKATSLIQVDGNIWETAWKFKSVCKSYFHTYDDYFPNIWNSLSGLNNLEEEIKYENARVLNSPVVKYIKDAKRIIKTVNPDFEMMTFTQFKKQKGIE